MIQKTPMINKIHELDQEASIDLIGNNRTTAMEILKDSPLIFESKMLPTKVNLKIILHTIGWINRRKYDVIFLPFSSTPVWLYFAINFCNAKKIVQHTNFTSMGKVDKINFLLMPIKLSKKIPVPILTGRHEIDLYFDLIQAFFPKPIERNHKSFVHFKKNHDVIKEYGIRHPYICIQVGAGNGIETPKKWPVENIEGLINLMNKHYSGITIVVVGTKKDLTPEVVSVLNKYTSIINVAGATSFSQLANIIVGAKLVICNDSGIMHVANALSVQLIALYGPTDYTRTAPLGKMSVMMREDLDCMPCMFNGQISEQEAYRRCSHKLCMYSLNSKMVFEVASKLLESDGLKMSS